MPDPRSIDRDRLLNELSGSLTPDRRSNLEPPPAPPQIPDHELVRCIGRGSYGEVWLARSAMGPWRAVKIVHRRSFEHDRPFERELAGIRRFEPVSRSHPSQLNILHVGRNDAAGCFYYVMELADDASKRGAAPGEVPGRFPAPPESAPACEALEGSPSGSAAYVARTLRHDLLHHGALPVEECLQIGLALATALDHLHRHGLVHRDIKPSNIIFVGGIPKLADIGLVAAAEATLSMVGTEGYLPPEGPGTPQADLYSLGKVLYEMATGRDRQDFPELPTHLIDQPKAERARLAELNEVIVRACHSDLRERYGTAAELHADLALLQSGKSVSRMRTVERRLRFVQRAGVLVTMVAALAGALYFWQSRQTEAMRELVEARTRLAQDNNRLAAESRSRLVQLHDANAIRVMDAGDSATAALWFAEALQLSEGDDDAERRQRHRLGTLFRYLPRPVAQLDLGITPAPTGTLDVTPSPDGEWLVAFGQSGPTTAEFRVWDAASLALLRSLTLTNVNFFRATRDGRWGMTRNGNLNQDRFWDLTTGTPLEASLERSGGGWFGFSPDGTRLATTVGEIELRILGVPSGRALTPPMLHSNRLDGFDWDPSGRWLATYSPAPGEPGQEAWLARVWDTSNGQPVTDWIETQAPVQTTVFDPRGRTVAIGVGHHPGTGESRGAVQVLDLPSGRPRFSSRLNLDRVISLAFSPDGRYLAVGQGNLKVQVLDARSGEVIHGSLTHGNRLPCLAFSPDGSWLAAAGEKEIVLWKVTSGLALGPPLAAASGWSYVDFTPDGTRLMAATGSSRIEVWDWSRVEPALPPMEGGTVDSLGPTGAQYSPDGHRLAVASDAGNVRVWDLETGIPLGPPLEPPRSGDFQVVRPDTAPSWAPDGTRLVLPTGDATARVWDVATGTEPFPPLQHAAAVACAEFSPDGSRIVTSDRKGTVQLWDGATGRAAAPPMHHNDVVAAVAFSRDGRRLATGSLDGTARVWDVATGAAAGPTVAFGGDVYVLDLSPDGARLAIGGRKDHVRLHDATTGQPQGRPLQTAGGVSMVQFSPDGTRVLTCNLASETRVWDAGTGLPLTPPMRHASYVTSGRFSPDGGRVVTASQDGTARVWDATTGEPLSPPWHHAGAVRGACFSPDGSSLVSVSTDGASVWEVAPFEGSPQDARVLARLWANSLVRPDGRLEPLTAAGRQEAWNLVLGGRVRDRVPSDHLNLLWHRRRAVQSLQRREWTAAEFHLRALLRQAPNDPQTLEGLARLRLLSPPPRNPATPPQLIDLSEFYNASLAPVPWHPGPVGNHLGELPKGVRTLADTRFDVRGLIQVAGRSFDFAGTRFPTEVKGIPIHQHASRLHLLQSTMGLQPPSGTWVGRYVVHFADGRRDEIPIRYGLDASDWHERPTEPAGIPEAVVAWRGMNPAAANLGHRGIRLFKRTWTNPAPDVEILRLDLIAEHPDAHPFLVALTAE